MKNSITDKYDLCWIAEKIKQEYHAIEVRNLMSFDNGNRIEHTKCGNNIYVVSSIGLTPEQVNELNDLLNKE